MIEPLVQAKYVLYSIDGEQLSDKLSHKDQRNMDRKLKGGAGRGQLTKTGEKQGFDLGRRVRKRYIEDLKFLNDDYNPNDL